MTDEDRKYYYKRAEAELNQAQRSTCTPAVHAHVELAERYIELYTGRPIEQPTP
jgi:hypothetical protein